jgi:hypothetical protein
LSPLFHPRITVTCVVISLLIISHSVPLLCSLILSLLPLKKRPVRNLVALDGASQLLQISLAISVQETS